MSLDLLLPKLLEKSATAALDFLGRAVTRKNDELLVEYERDTRERAEQAKLDGPFFKFRADAAPKISASFSSRSDLAKSAIAKHVELVEKWASVIRFADLEREKSVRRVYVELDVYLMPLNTHESEIERTRTAPLLKALVNSPAHCVILGGPGAGKTTSLRKICVDYFDRGKILLNYNFPILVQLREISGSKSATPLYDKLQELLAVEFDAQISDPTADMRIPAQLRKEVLNAYLDSLEAVVLLDGFDEISTEDSRKNVLEDIFSLTAGLVHTKVLLTSRSREFRYRAATIQKYEIASLTTSQVKTFALRWLPTEEQAEDFLKKVKRSPYADTTIRPLTLAHLCAIYERIQDIPEKPRSIYRRVVHLLLEEWDSQREISRKSSYGKFDVDRKVEFLAQLAFEMTANAKKLRFSDATLKEAYRRIHKDHGLPAEEYQKVIEEIESHSGLILESGYRTFEFAHKSIQEFLGADYIIRLPSLSIISKSIKQLPNELAIATALSSRPSDYLGEIILRPLLAASDDIEWQQTFLGRLVIEKPELHLHATNLSILAMLILVGSVEEVDDAVRMFRTLLPEKSARPVYDHYVEERESDGFCTFEGRRG